MNANIVKTICLVGNFSSTMINFRKELIIELVANGHRVYCLVADFDQQGIAKIESWGAKPIRHALDAKGLNPIKDLKATFDLARIFRQINPDVVMSFFVKPVIFGSVAAKLAGISRIVGMIEGLGNSFTNLPNGISRKAIVIQKIQIWLYRLSLPLLDAIVFLNPDDKRELLEKQKIKVKFSCVIGGIGVDLNTFKHTPVTNSDKQVFLFVGRLLREKGIFEFLEAAKIVKQSHANAEFIVVGGFDDKNPFAPKSDDLKEYFKSDIVRYVGEVINITDWLKGCSVFVLPSYREGVPRSTQEAMAIGRAVITTDVPGCRETVQDGVNGFLVPPFSAEALAEKMIFLIKNPNLVRSMGEISRRMAEQKFDIDIVNEKLCTLMFNEEK